jgi:phosphonopyruvate decarboxylase
MISAETFCAELADRGFNLATGVPCSYFGGPIKLLSRSPGKYLPAANEGGALGMAAGAALAGMRPYVMLQNSGLGNLINPLTSLTLIYQIPVLVFVSLRGWPDPGHDEPQHEVMGRSTHGLLDALGVARCTLRQDTGLADFRDVLDFADLELTRRGSPFVLVQKGAVGQVAEAVPAQPRQDGLASADVLRVAAAAARDCLVVASTGYTARELFAVADRPGHFYMQGSMGHASAIGLGIAHAHPGRKVVVLDGDGSALMHLGAMSVIGADGPENLIHLVLDNGMHESTGGQRTTSSTTSFAGVAKATGYRLAVECRTLTDVELFLHKAIGSAGPCLGVVRTRARTGPPPPRATSIAPAWELAERFAREIDPQQRTFGKETWNDTGHPAGRTGTGRTAAPDRRA